MLKQLSSRDKEWRKIALKIVSYYNVSNAEKKSLADDLVQNMYIKVYEQGKQWDEIKNSVEFYVYIVIRNLFYNHVREQKRVKEMFFLLPCAEAETSEAAAISPPRSL